MNRDFDEERLPLNGHGNNPHLHNNGEHNENFLSMFNVNRWKIGLVMAVMSVAIVFFR